MLYVERLKVAGRMPYVVVNKLEDTWRGTRGAVYATSDTWVYRFEPIKLVAKVRCLRPGRFTLKVIHSDDREEVFVDEPVYPGRFFDKSVTFYAGSEEGEEKVEFVFAPFFKSGQSEEYWFTIPVLTKPVAHVVRREGGRVVGRPVERTRTLPRVRKVAVLGVLGDYEGYERQLRSVFSEYTLKYGAEGDRNIVIKKAKRPHWIVYDGNLILHGDVDRLIPLCFRFKDYFRSQVVYRHEARIIGGRKAV